MRRRPSCARAGGCAARTLYAVSSVCSFPFRAAARVARAAVMRIDVLRRLHDAWFLLSDVVCENMPPHIILAVTHTLRTPRSVTCSVWPAAVSRIDVLRRLHDYRASCLLSGAICEAKVRESRAGRSRSRSVDHELSFVILSVVLL